jgi:hypothetical protein
MAIGGGNTFRPLRLGTQHLESWFALPATYPIGSGHQLHQRQAQSSVEEKFAVLLRNNNIVLLPQITDDLVGRRSRARNFIANGPLSIEPIASLCDFARGSNSDPLYLL